MTSFIQDTIDSDKLVYPALAYSQGAATLMQESTPLISMVSPTMQNLDVILGGIGTPDGTAQGSASIKWGEKVRRIARTTVNGAILSGDLALVTPYSPNAGFSVGLAMGRNKLIYTMADYALVVAADEGRGGTWSGANEVLRGGWVPVFVLDGPDVPEGNRALIERGGLPFRASLLRDDTNLRKWLDSHAPPPSEQVVQPKLL